jgi:hypothetical protein
MPKMQPRRNRPAYQSSAQPDAAKSGLPHRLVLPCLLQTARGGSMSHDAPCADRERWEQLREQLHGLNIYQEVVVWMQK